ELNERSVVGARLPQKNGTQPPAAYDRIQRSICVAQQPAPLADREIVYEGSNPTMLAGSSDIAVVPSQVESVHCVARNFSGESGAGPRFGVRQILCPGPR